MIDNKPQLPYLEHPFSLLFLFGLLLVNYIAIFQSDFLYIGAFFSFIYILIIPGFLLLPFLTRNKLPPALGIAFSVALSVFVLMFLGLGLNTMLPILGIHQPLNVVSLLLAFDAYIYALLSFNYGFKKSFPFEFHEFNAYNWFLVCVSFMLPVCACLGAIILNNNGSDFFAMFILALACVLVVIVLFGKNRLSPSAPPIALFMMALAFLLMNSMRGWYITGHDILLEYHVFILTYNAHLWSMSLYQDPYMACLSLTILPTYIVYLLHITPAYVFKFFTQFIGALPVVVIYYLTKEYTSERIAFLAGFLYISFPTFLVDMAFLNRQGIAFLFFSSLIFVLFSTEHFKGWSKEIILFIFGTGMIVSHYSTSYIAIPVLIGAYVLSKIVRFIVTAKKPQWLFNFTKRLSNREMYEKPILLKWPLVVGLLFLLIVWSTFITKTSTSLFQTIQQIVETVEHPFSLDEYSGPAKYNLFQAKQPSPQEVFNQFLSDGIKQANVSQYQSAFYPLSLTESYPATAIAETLAPLTPFGQTIQSVSHLNLVNFYNFIKEFYAKIIQLFLIIGLVGLMLGYSFKRNVLRGIPVEFIALCISGIAVMVGQTVLPADAIDYGLLRLFQQNLIFLALPITLGLLWLTTFVTKDHTKQLMICAGVYLFSFIILSGFIPQLTGGSRAPLALDNYGLYYDSYYTHAQEVYSAEWIAKYGDHSLTIQAAHFSDMKILAYGQIGAYIELLPETVKRQSYVYLNYDNVKTSNILEIVDGNVVYYHFPMAFLENYKNLIYNNGGSEIYR